MPPLLRWTPREEERAPAKPSAHGFRATTGNFGDLPAAQADVGQFAIGQARQFPIGPPCNRPASLPCAQLAKERSQRFQTGGDDPLRLHVFRHAGHVLALSFGARPIWAARASTRFVSQDSRMLRVHKERLLNAAMQQMHM